MPLKVKVGAMECQKLDEAALRERFKRAFELDPTLTPSIYWKMLVDSGFDEDKSLWKVVDRVRKPNEFLVPDFLLRSVPPLSKSDPFTTPIKQIIPPFDYAERPSPMSTSKKGPYRSRDDSDDEILFPKTSAKSTPIQALVSPFTGTPNIVPTNNKDNSFADSKQDTDDDDEDNDIRQRKKRHRAQLAPLRPPKSKLRSNRNGGASLFKKASHFKPTQASQSTSTSESFGEESGMFVPAARKGGTQDPKIPTTKDLKTQQSDTLESDLDEEDNTSSEESDDVTSPKDKRSSASTPRRRANQNEAVLKHRIKSMATPLMHMLACRFFPTTLRKDLAGGSKHLEIGEKNVLDVNKYLADLRDKVWAHEPKSIEFHRPAIWERKGRQGYASVDIDGITYSVGDCCIVRSTETGAMNKKKGRNASINSELGNEDGLLNPWYARIVYFFQDEAGDKMAHFRWFQHGSAASIEEMANPYELFLLTECDDAPLDCIYSKIRVSDKGKDPSDIVELNLEKDEYFYRFHFHKDAPDKEALEFTDSTLHESHDEPTHHAGPKCDCCDRLAKAIRSEQTRIIGVNPDNGRNRNFEAFRRHGVDYHLHDFVYIFDDSLQPYRIGSIESIYLPRRYPNSSKPRATDNNLMVKIALYERYDKLYSKTYFEEFEEGKEHVVRDSRRLYKSGVMDRLLVNQIDGKCYVRHLKDIKNLEQWKAEDDRFWVSERVSAGIDGTGKIRRPDLRPLKSLEYARHTEEDLDKQAKRLQNFIRDIKPLRTLDVFGGGGGLSLGLDRSGAAETKWICEFSPAGCISLRRNFPKARVYELDASVFLDRAIRLHNGEDLEPILDHDGRAIPDPPRKGEVEFICGGPPCPGFSKANGCPKAEDIKNSLIILYLSFLDFYRPQYFLLENVEPILTYRLGATQVSKNKTEGGIEKGMKKLILRAMTCMGYQCSVGVVQAAEHNIPQDRTRAIFWGAQRGYQLPQFPKPRNVVQKNRQWRSNGSRRAAPFPTVTLGDALTDLPAFDWMNPHLKIKETEEQRLDRAKRSLTIEQYNCQEYTNFVGKDHQSYASEPVSEYQRLLRAGVPKDQLFNHVTLRWDEATTQVIEQVCNVPMRPDADHRDLPAVLVSWCLSSDNPTALRNKCYPGRIGRLDTESIAGTCMTRIEPGGKGGKVLHPTQHRVETVRELARIMSFPDSYFFDLSKMRVADAIRQLGNAVPPNLGYDIGRELFFARMEDYEEDQRRLEKINIDKKPTPVKELQAPVTEIQSLSIESNTPRKEGGGHQQGSQADPITVD